MSELNTKLIWLMAVRILVLLSLLLPNLINPTGDDLDGGLVRIAAAFQELLDPTADEDPVSGEKDRPSFAGQLLQLLVAVVSIQTLLYASLVRLLRDRPHVHGYIQIFGDLLLVTLLIYKFGGATANLSVLYFGVIVVASFLLRRRGALVAATAAAVLYALVAVAHQSSGFRDLWEEGGAFSAPTALEQPSGERTPMNPIERIMSWAKPPERGEVTGVPVAYTVPVHVLGFYSIALFAAYLARDLALERKLEQRSTDLAYLRVLYGDVIQSISSGLLVTDLGGLTTSINRAGAHILGLEDTAIEQRPVWSIGLFSEDQWRELTREEDQAKVTRGELERIQDDGTLIFLGYTLSPLRDESGGHRGFIIIFQDLSEWRQMQDQLRIQDRMAALGQMAAGLAHEVGNPLAAISGSVQMLSGQAESGSASAKLLDITLRESRRLDRTVKNFLQFARPRDRHEEPVDICEVLDADLELLRNSDEVMPGHELVHDLDPPSVVILLDRDQISQIYWNLSRNALQAMPNGGTLRVEGRLIDERYRLRFSDTGRGMSDEERDQLFQPFKSFFDGGMGLGMAIVYRIVEEHRGNIEVDSEPGRGTTITIDLPLDGGGRFEEMPT